MANKVGVLYRLGGSAYEKHHGIRLPPIHLKALRATGASALLAQGASITTVQPLGRWKSDAALRYLHLQHPVCMSGVAQSMLPGPPPTGL
jgi:hypothetical protein